MAGDSQTGLEKKESGESSLRCEVDVEEWKGGSHHAVLAQVTEMCPSVEKENWRV